MAFKSIRFTKKQGHLPKDCEIFPNFLYKKQKGTGNFMLFPFHFMLKNIKFSRRSIRADRYALVVLALCN